MEEDTLRGIQDKFHYCLDVVHAADEGNIKHL